MNYAQLSQEYQDDHLATAMFSREMEHFHYDFDRRNFLYLIGIAPDGAFKEDLKKRLSETEAQIRNVELIYAALKEQIRSIEAHAAAVERVMSKQKDGAK